MDGEGTEEARYVSQLKMNLISVGALKALDPESSVRDGILKMTRGSMMILKGVQRNNLYYLNGSTTTRQVATSTNSDNDCIRLGI